MSVLGPAEGMSFIAPCWGVESSPPDSAGLYVFNSDGQLRPGFPLLTSEPIWGSAVVTDLNNDGTWRSRSDRTAPASMSCARTAWSG
jgi:hypothetical protein